MVEVVIGRFRQIEWDETLAGFSDASIYQTWAYGAARWGNRSLSHLVVRKDGRAIGMAQVRVAKLPLLPAGVAYIGWGPAWQPKESEPDIENFRSVLDALKQEYVLRRKLHLHLVPNIVAEQEHPSMGILTDFGFATSPSHNRTILLDLSPPLEQLRSGLRRRWRQTLDKAERNGLEWAEGDSLDLYDEALRVYEEMHDRKQFAEFVNKQQFAAMQAALPAPLKMRILVGRAGGEPIAAIAWSVIGDTGLPLLAATGRKALGNDAAYVMWWRMLAWLQENGYRWLDLGGINPERNPGGYTFKSGLAKKGGREVTLLGSFDLCTNLVSRACYRFARWRKTFVSRQKHAAEQTQRKHPNSAASPAVSKNLPSQRGISPCSAAFGPIDQNSA